MGLSAKFLLKLKCFEMSIYKLVEINDTVLEAFERLIPQLSANAEIPTRKELEAILAFKNTLLFIAEDNKEIQGMLTLIFNKIPTGDKVWIEDVVVDSNARGVGIGQQLVQFAINYVSDKKISAINLTSSPDRISANKLYQKLGFEKRETNVYRLKIR